MIYLSELSKSLTQKQKADAFDILLNGGATGMSIFWESFDSLKEFPQNEVLENMYKLACTEALEVLFGIRN